MDIADIELVIVYGLPTTMAMLYQVYVQQYCFYCIDLQFNNFIQMFGRAGRGGVEAVAQLIYTTKEANTELNTQLVDFASNKENCRRRTLLHNMGSCESVIGDHVLCCDVCSSGIVPYCRLRFLMKRPHVGRVRKRRCGQKLTPQQYNELLSRLTKERDIICCSSAGFSYLGPDVLCPHSVINQLCKIAQSVHTIDDIKIPGLRPQLYDKFFEIISNILGR